VATVRGDSGDCYRSDNNTIHHPVVAGSLLTAPWSAQHRSWRGSPHPDAL